VTQTYGVQVGTVSEQFNTLLTRLQDDPLSVLQPLFLGTSQAFGVIGQVIGTTTEVALILVLIPIYFFFFSWHFDEMTNTISRFLPFSRKERTLRIIGRMDRAVSGFFRGRLVIAVITGVLFGVGWALTDVPYWFLLGIATGVLNIIPYASAVGWPLAIALKYLDAVTGSGGSVDWLSIALWPSLSYLIVQFIDGWLLTPWIQSQSTDMSAVTVLIVVFIGGAVGGFLWSALGHSRHRLHENFLGRTPHAPMGTMGRRTLIQNPSRPIGNKDPANDIRTSVVDHCGVGCRRAAAPGAL
jgi:predicted PurR-regulated permease PerM